MKWHDNVRRILESPTGNLVEMANAAGVNPSVLYRGQNFTGVDLRGQDLRGIDFSGADLTGAVLDRQTLIDLDFDPRLKSGFVRRNIKLSRNLFICVRLFEADIGYIYTGWAIKWLIERGYHLSQVHGQIRSWTAWYEQSQSVQHLVNQAGGNDYLLKIQESHYDALVDSFRHLGGSNKAIKFGILIAIMSYWNSPPERIGGEPLFQFIQKVKKRASADALLLSLAKSWSEP